MVDSIVRLKVEDNSFNAQIKEAAKAFATFGKNVASAGTQAFRQFATGATSAKVAFQGFNAALKANALVLVASLAVQAASAIGEMICDWVRGADDAASAQENLNQKLEETKRLVEDINSEGDFNARLAKAAGASTTDVLKIKKDAAEKAKNEAMATLLDPKIKVGTEEYDKAKQIYEAAEKRYKKAVQDLKVDEVAKKNRTGEYAPRNGGGGGKNKKTTDPTEKFWEQWNKTFRKSWSMSSEFKPEEPSPGSQVWVALQEQADEIKKVDIVSPLQAMQNELKSLTTWRDQAETPEEWQKRNQVVAAKQNQIKQFKGEGNKQQKDDSDKSLKDIRENISNFTSGISSIASGIEHLGIEVPEGLTRVVGSLQAITSILVGIEALIEVGNFLGIFHAGGVVHAANGFAGTVPGSRYSGDHIPILANAGEVVLTRAMAGNLASQLNGNALADLNLTATIRGEQIRLAINNNGRRTGRGEYVQTNRMKG